jgi:hypothetical protein
MRATLRLAATDAFTDLVLHVLAHVSVPGPEDLFEPRYIAWAEGRTPTDLHARLREDADVLAHRWRSVDGLVLQAWPDLHPDLPAFVTTRVRALADVQPHEVACPIVLARLQRCTPAIVELVHAQLGLLAPWFAQLHADAIAPAVAEVLDDVADVLADAATVMPDLAGERIELAWALGPRGRGLATRIVVGAPAAWNGMAPATSAVLVLHEQAVRRADASEWASAEWTALRELARVMRGAPARLRSAHTDWLASLELVSLVSVLQRRGAIDVGLAMRLIGEPHARAELLARV